MREEVSVPLVTSQREDFQLTYAKRVTAFDPHVTTRDVNTGRKPPMSSEAPSRTERAAPLPLPSTLS